MGICRLCERVIGDQDGFCRNCGYDPRTDTINPAFVRKERKSGTARRQRMVSPGVKGFAFWGMIVVIFSLGFQYQGKILDFAWGAKDLLSGKKPKKSTSVKASAASGQKPPTRLLDVRSYQAPVNKSALKDKKIEGIFYDPQGKSYVVVSGQLVSQGESFAGMVIEKINQDSVEVVEDGNRKTLKVSK